MQDIEKKETYPEVNPSSHSDEVEEIMGRQPAWIVRWGITVLLMILLGIILACCVIRYPQTVSGVITLTSESPSADLTARYTGILDSVTVSNGDTVSKGQLLSLVANAARYEDILLAEKKMEYSGMERVMAIANCQDLQLGSVQSPWLELKTACRNYADYLQIDQIGKKSVY